MKATRKHPKFRGEDREYVKQKREKSSTNDNRILDGSGWPDRLFEGQDGWED